MLTRIVNPFIQATKQSRDQFLAYVTNLTIAQPTFQFIAACPLVAKIFRASGTNFQTV